jgi:hypothetical protein
MTDPSRPQTAERGVASRAIFNTLRSLRHLADRAVQTGLFKLVPRAAASSRQQPVGRACIIVYMVSSTAR